MNTRPTHRATAALALSLAAGLTLTPAAAAQDSYVWAAAAPTDAWDDPLNWLNTTLGGIVAGFPQNGDHATFDADADAAPASERVDALSIDPGVTLTLGRPDTASLQIDETLLNNGTLSITTDTGGDQADGPDQRLFIATQNPPTAFSGSGRLLLNGPETGIRSSNAVITFLTNGENHTIEGNGIIQRFASITNNGAINAANGNLTIDNSDINNAPDAEINISPAATLLLTNNTNIDGGTINGNGTTSVLDASDSAIANITIQNTATFGAGDSSSLTIRGTITNDAELTFATDQGGDNRPGPDQRFLVPVDDATLAGSGYVELNGPETGFLGNNGVLSQLSNTDEHVITGHGVIEVLNLLVNAGQINPEDGVLTLRDLDADNTDGLIDIGNDATLRLENASIANGTISGENSHDEPAAIISANNATLQNLNLTGQIRIGTVPSTTLTLQGAINNTAILSIDPDNDGNDDIPGPDQQLLISVNDATLQGPGRLILNGPTTGIRGANGVISFLTIESSITGSGIIEQLGGINNRDVINPAGGTLSIRNANTNNDGGSFDIDADATLELINADIDHGSIEGQPGSRLIGDSASQLSDLSIAGTISAGGGASSTTQIAGLINNDAHITIPPDDGNDDLDGPDQRLLIASAPPFTVLEGTGTITLEGHETGLRGANAVLSNLENTENHTIQGDGLIDRIATLRNRGRIAPGNPETDPTQTLTLDPATFELAEGTLAFDIESTTTGEADRIHAIGNIDLAGNLELNLIDGFTPTLGDRFTVLTATGDITGFFDTLDLPFPVGAPDDELRVAYNDASVEVVFTCRADANADGGVNAADLLLLLGNFGSSNGAIGVDGDITPGPVGDGNVNAADLLLLLNQLGRICS